MLTSPRGTHGILERAVNECLACHAACVATVADGAGEQSGGLRRSLLACAIITRSCADILLLGTPDVGAMCGAAAAACDAAAMACVTAGSALSLEECAYLCRQCAGTCRDVVTAKA